jgi:serine/threonine protein kinase
MAFDDFAMFTLADRSFYDSPDQMLDSDSLLNAVHRPTPSDWTREVQGLWIVLHAQTRSLPSQGWKIHISSTPRHADEITNLVWEFCVRRSISFKFLRSRAAVLAVNSKYWSRASSGKVITIYPTDDAEFARVLESLHPKLLGLGGPYILSDLRYLGGPLFVRYGGFKPLWIEDGSGIRVPALLDSDGRLVLDRREPVFMIPSFAQVPEIMQPILKEPPGAIRDFPYEVERALHFSNGGGIYLARVPSGEKVVLREGRPLAGLDGIGSDAVTRLRNEEQILTRLSGLSCVPAVVDHFVAWEHDYLVTSYIPGRTLLEEIIERYPLVHPDPSGSAATNYVKWVCDIIERLFNAIEQIHARGVRVGDIHPRNVIIRPDGGLALVDFESSSELRATAKIALGAPGFVPPASLSGEAADYYAASCVALMMLLPLSPLLDLHVGKARTFLDVVSANLPIDTGTLEKLRHGLAIIPGDDCPDEAAGMFAQKVQWTSARDSLVAGILATASPDRADRLFPGDPLQFRYGGATLAYGAAGVLLALSRAGSRVPVSFVDWLVNAAHQGTASQGNGLYDGLHGVAYVLAELGARNEALDVLERALSTSIPRRVGLFNGKSGVALNLLHFGKITGDKRMIWEAVRVGNELSSLVLEEHGLTVTEPGLMDGGTGLALLFLHLYDETHDTAYLDAALVALKQDLSFGTLLPDGTFHLRSGSRYLIYLDGGSAGIALVLARFLKYRHDPNLVSLLASIRRGCRIPFVLQPGLFQGRSGMIVALADTAKSEEDRADVEQQICRLGWHAIRHKGELAFPGTGLVRLSCDLATGSAGVLVALQCAITGQPSALPFL